MLGELCPKVPAAKLTFVKGEPVDVGGAQPGVVQVLEWWSTWCPPCRASIPHISELARKYRPQGARFVGITSEAEVPKVKGFVEKMGDKMDYTVALDASGAADAEIYMRTGARGIPHALVVGADGRVAFSGHPMEPGFEAAIGAALKAVKPAAAAAKTFPPVTQSYEELMALPVKALRALLAERRVDARDCLEKGDLARRVLERCQHEMTVSSA